MLLLNSKNIYDCNEYEEIIHNYETQIILSKLSKYPNYNCAVIIKYFDEANKNNTPIIKKCKLHDCFDIVQYTDIKNGTDLAVVDNFLTFICYGSEYQYKNSLHLITTGIQIRPYNESKVFIHLNF